jgi:hypothetical protein
MLQTNQTIPTTSPKQSDVEIAALIEDIRTQQTEYLTDYREVISYFENAADEMLTTYADALIPVESLSLPQFELGWREKLLQVVQELFTLPRWIFREDFPAEYQSLRRSYQDFVMEADGMGEDMLEFMIAVERRHLKEVRNLFADLREGLRKLETMLTTRWREIARLSRQLELPKKLADPFRVAAQAMAFAA